MKGILKISRFYQNLKLLATKTKKDPISCEIRTGKKLKSTFTDHISHKSSIKTTIVIKIQLKIAFLTDFQENNKRLHVSYFE